jgi:hypothetical protein
MKKLSMTREEWLQKAIKICDQKLFSKHGLKCPAVKVSVGLPYGKKAIGEHWHPEASEDKLGSIFISPIMEEAGQVLGTLVHELVHAAVGNEAGHGPEFKKAATAVGLIGKMRATSAGDELVKFFNDVVIKKIGDYPHRKLNMQMRPAKKQTTRMIKCECSDCGYICRTSKTNIENYGAPLCPCNKEEMGI